MKYTQIGRSMIEMLGVLAIIGVLSVGGLDMITKSRRNNQIAIILSDVSNVASILLQQRKYSPEVKESYNGNFILFLYKTGKIPAEITYNSTSKNLQSELNSTISAEIDTNDIVTIKISSLDKETCLKIASNNWGSRTDNRFVGLIVGANADFSCVNNAENPCNAGTNSAFAGKDGYPMSVAKAVAACSSQDSNIVNLAYKF